MVASGTLLTPPNLLAEHESAKIGKRSIMDLVTSGFELGDLIFAFETPGPHKSMDQPKFGKGHLFTLVT